MIRSPCKAQARHDHPVPQSCDVPQFTTTSRHTPSQLTAGHQPALGCLNPDDQAVSWLPHSLQGAKGCPAPESCTRACRRLGRKLLGRLQHGRTEHLVLRGGSLHALGPAAGPGWSCPACPHHQHPAHPHPAAHVHCWPVAAAAHCRGASDQPMLHPAQACPAHPSLHHSGLRCQGL